MSGNACLSSWPTLQGRYRELLLLVETCQAESLHMQLRSPNVLAIAASKIGAPPCGWLEVGPAGRLCDPEAHARQGVSPISHRRCGGALHHILS